MVGYIVSFAIGILCVLLGISNMKGNISSIHSYHRQRVTEENRIPFGKKVGLGTVIIGISIVAFSILSALTLLINNNIFVLIGSVVMTVGIIIGLAISFYAMIKYNKGIF